MTAPLPPFVPAVRSRVIPDLTTAPMNTYPHQAPPGWDEPPWHPGLAKHEHGWGVLPDPKPQPPKDEEA